MIADPSNGYPDQWMHELRNAINSATLAAFAADKLMSAGDMPQAHVFLQQIQEACDQCRLLVHQWPPER